jgi:hypothetical protein
MRNFHCVLFVAAGLMLSAATGSMAAGVVVSGPAASAPSSATKASTSQAGKAGDAKSKDVSADKQKPAEAPEAAASAASAASGLPFHPRYKPTEVQLTPEQVATIQARVTEQMAAHHALLRDKSAQAKVTADLAILERSQSLEAAKSFAARKDAVLLVYAALSVLAFLVAMALVVVALLLTARQLSKDATRADELVRVVTDAERKVQALRKVAANALAAEQTAQGFADRRADDAAAATARRAAADAGLATAKTTRDGIKAQFPNPAPGSKEALSVQENEANVTVAEAAAKKALGDETRATADADRAKLAAQAARDYASRVQSLLPGAKAAAQANAAGAAPGSPAPAADSDLASDLAAVMAAMRSDEKVTLGSTGFTLGTQTVGVLMLVITLGFFILYLERVFPATVLAGYQSAASAPSTK